MSTKHALITILLEAFVKLNPDSNEATRRDLAMRLYLLDVTELELLVSQLKTGEP